MLTDSHLIIIMAYASGGGLFQYVQMNGRLSEDVARYFFRQLVTAVEAMHSSGICHQNLKLENALIDIVDEGDIRLQLCDFGASKHVFMDTSLEPGELAPIIDDS